MRTVSLGSFANGSWMAVFTLWIACASPRAVPDRDGAGLKSVADSSFFGVLSTLQGGVPYCLRQENTVVADRENIILEACRQDAGVIVATRHTTFYFSFPIASQTGPFYLGQGPLSDYRFVSYETQKYDRLIWGDERLDFRRYPDAAFDFMAEEESFAKGDIDNVLIRFTPAASEWAPRSCLAIADEAGKKTLVVVRHRESNDGGCARFNVRKVNEDELDRIQ